MRKLFVIVFISVFIVLSINKSSQASPVVWANNASNGTFPIILEAFDGSTGLPSDQISVNNTDGMAVNGRGVAIDGTTIYYSARDSNNVYITDSETHNDLGIAFNTDAQSLNGIASISILNTGTGKEFWLTDYGNYVDINNFTTSMVYRYSSTGNSLGSISGFGNVREGFEIVQIGNETKVVSGSDYGAAPYNLYNLDGTISQSNFIDPSAHAFETHGITFDGTFYYIADQGNCQIDKYNSGGSFVSEFSLGCSDSNNTQRLLEDLAISYNIPTSVPEPSAIILMIFGILALETFRRIIGKVKCNK